MKERFVKKAGMAAVAFGAASLLVSCGGRKADQASQLGQENVTYDENEISTQQQVTRTITSDMPTVRQSVVRGNINQMKPEHFSALGVPQTVAENIVKYREDNDAGFRSVDDLRNVNGMNDQLFARIKDKVAVGPKD